MPSTKKAASVVIQIPVTAIDCVSELIGRRVAENQVPSVKIRVQKSLVTKIRGLIKINKTGE